MAVYSWKIAKTPSIWDSKAEKGVGIQSINLVRPQPATASQPDPSQPDCLSATAVRLCSDDGMAQDRGLASVEMLAEGVPRVLIEMPQRLAH